jgi:hypothetical protein
MTDATIEFLALANRAGAAYLEKGVPLEESIAKLAEDNELSRMQIQRVVELANHHVNEALLQKTADKTYRFPVASVDGVLSKIHPTVKTAGVTAPEVRTAMGSIVGDLSRRGLLEKLAAKITEAPEEAQRRVKDALNAVEKIAARIETYERVEKAKLGGVHEEIRKSLDELTQYTKDHIFSGGSAYDIFKYAHMAHPEDAKTWEVLFHEVGNRLQKMAAFETPSPSAHAAYHKLVDSVVDGWNKLAAERKFGNGLPKVTHVKTHGILTILDTLKNKISEQDKLAKHINLLGDAGPAVVKLRRHFRSTSDVQKFLDKDLHKLAEIVQEGLESALPVLEELAKTAAPLFPDFAAAGAATRSIGKGLWGAAKAGGSLVRYGAKGLKYGIPAAAGLGVLKAFNEAGKSMGPITRNWRPSADRGINQGGGPVHEML